MVHRIQNRNPGYSDFGTNSATASFQFSNNNSNPATIGANALKLENEIISKPFNDNSLSESMDEETFNSQEIERIVENNQSNDHEQSFSEEALSNSTSEANENDLATKTEEISNGLENFGVENETSPDLFDSNDDSIESEGLLTSENREDSLEEDDLEIPAFLRRQKN